MTMETKKLSWKEFIEQFAEEVRDRIAANRKRAGVDGMAMLVCHVLDSSKIGERVVLMYGPSCTFQTLEMLQSMTAGVYTNGLPSSASFAESYTTDVPV
jgi:trehalose utilization protein